MYNLYYWVWGEKLMATFANYADGKKALEILTAKYPTAKIWLEPVRVTNSLEEWQDKYNGEIAEYERNKT
jgi:hypothetical protein